MADVVLNRAIKYRAYPTEEQVVLINKTFGCVRFIWNQMLGDHNRFYEETDLHFIPTPAKYKKSHAFLKEVDSLALANAQIDLNGAFAKFFAGDAGYPKFKSKKHCKMSYTTNCQTPMKKDGTRSPTVYVHDSYVHLPKVGEVRICKHRSPKNGWTLKNATIEKTPTGKYYISVMYEFTEDISSTEVKTSVGLDYSSHDFYVDSTGEKANYDRYYRQSEEKLARAQRKLSRMKPGSKNYNKQKRRVAAIHEKIANQRKDFCHRKSAAITKQYDAVFVEDINLRGMAGSLHLGKSTNDNGFGMFRDMLEYKLRAQGKTFLKVERSYPSSQLCHVCGYQNPATKDLSVRKWVCPNCGVYHDRDHNAAINIRNRGLELLAQQ